MKVFLVVVLIAVVVFVLFVVIGTCMSCYYSIPYEEWVQIEQEKGKAERRKQKRKRGSQNGRG